MKGRWIACLKVDAEVGFKAGLFGPETVNHNLIDVISERTQNIMTVGSLVQ